jgi:hypothetical protein
MYFQPPSPLFNKASTMNMGFLEVRRMFNPDCYIFHDVDFLPEDDRNLYRCEDMPLHLCVALDKDEYRYVRL